MLRDYKINELHGIDCKTKYTHLTNDSNEFNIKMPLLWMYKSHSCRPPLCFLCFPARVSNYSLNHNQRRESLICLCTYRGAEYNKKTYTHVT